ncbi:hypothetical protein SFRURICE_007586 [Spodoptera frugiperda]|nr:hypothetical protein SFRURICE_007586 [Spodoptera frugiperda]
MLLLSDCLVGRVIASATVGQRVSDLGKELLDLFRLFEIFSVVALSLELCLVCRLTPSRIKGVTWQKGISRESEIGALDCSVSAVSGQLAAVRGVAGSIPVRNNSFILSMILIGWFIRAGVLSLVF